MGVLQDEMIVATRGRGSLEVTDRVDEFVRASGLLVGSLHLFLKHTSASLLVTENADPQVREDLERWFGELAPDGHPTFRHVDEGPDDMPAHARTLLAGHSLLLPVSGGELVLGRWQGVFLWEHRTAPHRRHLFMTLQGEFAPPR